MSRLSLFHMAFGFLVIVLAACLGIFLVRQVEVYEESRQNLLSSWSFLLLKSSHGHTNLFGILHILFGLTLPYSFFSTKIKYYQGLGLLCGTFSMGVLMILRYFINPLSFTEQFIKALLGVLLSFALISLGSHSYSLFYKVLKRM